MNHPKPATTRHGSRPTPVFAPQSAPDGREPAPGPETPPPPRSAVPAPSPEQQSASPGERTRPQRGPVGFRHGACGTSWTGARTAHCSGCCATFSGITLFDAHRVGYGERGSCRDPREMPGVTLTGGVWSYPAMTADELQARFGGGR